VQIDGRLGVTYVAFVDLGAVHDPTVIAVGHEGDGCAFIDRLETYQGSREEPVQIARIEEAVARVAKAFKPVAIRVESWQGLGAVQSLSALGLPVELFTPTQKTNAEEWPILGQRLAARTLVLPPQRLPSAESWLAWSRCAGRGISPRPAPRRRAPVPRHVRRRSAYGQRRRAHAAFPSEHARRHAPSNGSVARAKLSRISDHSAP
jgi:hypothetical protein